MKNRIRELRERRGLTQEQLGDLVGASRQAINAIETGKFEPSVWLAYDISNVFGHSVEEVFLFEESVRKSRADRSRRDYGGDKADIEGIPAVQHSELNYNNRIITSEIENSGSETLQKET